MGYLAEKYGIRDKPAKPQKDAISSSNKSKNTKEIGSRRYLVRAIAHFPPGTIWAYACSKLASAEQLFERKRAEGGYDVLELLDRHDRDEHTAECRILRSTAHMRECGPRHSW